MRYKNECKKNDTKSHDFKNGFIKWKSKHLKITTLSNFSTLLLFFVLTAYTVFFFVSLKEIHSPFYVNCMIIFFCSGCRRKNFKSKFHRSHFFLIFFPFHSYGFFFFQSYSVSFPIAKMIQLNSLSGNDWFSLDQIDQHIFNAVAHLNFHFFPCFFVFFFASSSFVWDCSCNVSIDCRLLFSPLFRIALH